MDYQKDSYCKACGTRLEKKDAKRKPSQLKKKFYYTAYLQCPACQRIYHDNKFKVVNRNFDLFTQKNLNLSQFEVDIWTDGACVHNGTGKAKAAWAFVAGKFEMNGPVEGKQTNNTAEAYAIYHALVWAAEKGYRSIQIHTDSQITIHGLQKPVEKVKENREIFEKIAKLIAEKELDITYQKVLGHAGNPDNERADKLANTLASRS